MGGISSNYLNFPVNINYFRSLRSLEEAKADCFKKTNVDNEKDNIQYNCTAPINQNANSFTVSINSNALIFGNGDKVDYTVSSLANKSKNDI